MEYCSGAARTSRLKWKTNIEIKNQQKVESKIIVKVDERRLKRFGHVRWMEDNRLPKIRLNWNPTCKSSRRKPTKQWKDNLTETDTN